MAKAVWNGAVLAASDETVVVEGNHYFPPQSLNGDYFLDSAHTSLCPWKGTASYFHIVVGDARNENAAWSYRDPKPAAAQIKDHVAFWKGVTVDA
jgi:uncharacterized protein (DUF427 family)